MAKRSLLPKSRRTTARVSDPCRGAAFAGLVGFGVGAVVVVMQQTSRILRLELRRDGSAGRPEPFCQLPGGPRLDGIAFGVDGKLCVERCGAP
jgi:hypothetical protein